MAAGACAAGPVFTLAVVLPAPRVSASLLADLYLGRVENPQWGGGRVDAKMYLYLVGAILLELNVASFTARHLRLHPGDPSPGVLLYAGLFTFFVVEYLSFERVHLYTYDFFAERVGFKLGWGCLVFYPFFYCVGLWSVAERPNPRTPLPLLVACGLLFLLRLGALARGQPAGFLFKTEPQKRLFGLIAPVALSGGGKQLLCSGFWGLSRHINYLGEILMAPGARARARVFRVTSFFSAVPAVLRGAPPAAPAPGRPALRREVRRPVGGVLPQGASPHHPLGVLKRRISEPRRYASAGAGAGGSCRQPVSLSSTMSRRISAAGTTLATIPRRLAASWPRNVPENSGDALSLRRRTPGTSRPGAAAPCAGSEPHLPASPAPRSPTRRTAPATPAPRSPPRARW